MRSWNTKRKLEAEAKNKNVGGEDDNEKDFA